MINRTVLVGRLTKDPELRSTPNGVNVGTFTLAVNRTFTNAQGEREADFINVVVFKKQAENVERYLSKGSLAGVDGRLQTRSYENKDGQRVFVTEVVADSVQFLEPKSNNQQQNNSYNAPQNRQQNNPFANANGPIDISSDDLPF
ncbi:TPA: single-stranded DNA-binding protein [Staphylococcus aureus]|nr:single-stranded DNA-binding protein [Staphylococcus aureus]HDF5479622.1 single-stranded DNA-binding protein [Staphylococcus aureus]HDF6371273.1 single-stranded DNA-binding protein [Staphylococcus aureus]